MRGVMRVYYCHRKVVARVVSGCGLCKHVGTLVVEGAPRVRVVGLSDSGPVNTPALHERFRSMRQYADRE